ncbi:MAG: hypothetical protein QOE69_2009 [Thermoleophilaceae bacterium]|jgi:hypothetical protein|nr:hypothetical protein [Thermoleophilaceae bacterium]MEA2407890.1 hypothetical protein [Thermoleophilaceae bacterium]
MSDSSTASDGGRTREGAERAMRRLLAENDLPEPDEIRDHEDGGIVCLWHGPKVAVVVDLEPAD